jgi:hypothetical protein
MLDVIKRTLGFGLPIDPAMLAAVEQDLATIRFQPEPELKDKAAEASQLIMQAADAEEQFCISEIDRHGKAIDGLTEKLRIARLVKATYAPTIPALVEAHHTDGYDAADDSRRSYDALVEAKRKRGDKHWRRPASEKAELAVVAAE